MSTFIACCRLNHRLLLLGAVFVLALTASCEQSEVATPRPVVVQIAGATSMHPALEELSAAFTQRHPSVLIDIRGGGSALGEARVRNGRSALGASTLPPDAAESRPPLVAGNPAPATTDPSASASTATADAEAPAGSPAPTRRAAPSQLAPLSRVPIGVDAIGVIVHADNPVTAFTSMQLRDVFGGRLLDWEELGGKAGEIVLVSREDGSGTRHAFESRIMRDRDVSLTAVVMPTSADVVEYVSKNPLAIGYVSTAYLATRHATQSEAETADDAPAVHAAALDGVLPSDETVSDQSYPLIQPLYLVTNGPPQGWARQFIDFALSPAGQAIVDRFHAPVR